MKIESLKEMTIQQLISMIENSDIEICELKENMKQNVFQFKIN